MDSHHLHGLSSLVGTRHCNARPLDHDAGTGEPPSYSALTEIQAPLAVRRVTHPLRLPCCASWKRRFPGITFTTIDTARVSVRAPRLFTDAWIWPKPFVRQWLRPPLKQTLRSDLFGGLRINSNIPGEMASGKLPRVQSCLQFLGFPAVCLFSCWTKCVNHH